LGRLSPVASTADILLFFPQAIHKNPHSGYYANQVPKDIQDLFWNKVLIPALRETSPAMREPYTPANQAHSHFKQGKSKKGQPSTLPIGPPQINRLFSEIEKG